METFKKPLNSKQIEKKLKLASDLFEFAYQMKCFQIKNKCPNLTDKEIRFKAYALIDRGCS